MPKKYAIIHYREWLEARERGKSEVSIAREAGCDVRTAKRGIEQARQERDVTQVRAKIVMEAMKEHYAELIGEARRLKEAVSSPVSANYRAAKGASAGALEESLGRTGVVFPAAGKQRKLNEALQEHLGRKFSKQLQDYENLQEKIMSLLGGTEALLRQEVDRRLRDALGYEANAKGFPKSALAHVLNLLQGGGGLIEVCRYNRRAGSKPNTTVVEWGIGGSAYVLVDGLRSDEDGEKVIPIHEAFLSELGTRDEAAELGKVIEQRAKIVGQLEDELDALELKHIVPGKCQYCLA